MCTFGLSGCRVKPRRPLGRDGKGKKNMADMEKRLRPTVLTDGKADKLGFAASKTEHSSSSKSRDGNLYLDRGTISQMHGSPLVQQYSVFLRHWR